MQLYYKIILVITKLYFRVNIFQSISFSLTGFNPNTTSGGGVEGSKTTPTPHPLNLFEKFQQV